MADKERNIVETIRREQSRLWNFIRRRVPDAWEAEEILQDVFFEYVEAYRLPEPIEQAGAWLFRVARNRIVDRFRKRRESALPSAPDEDEADQADQADEARWLESMLPASTDGPEAAYTRSLLVRELTAALDELPPEQREVFIAHEVEGQSFKAIAADTGVPVNTLLARKRYAILRLRERLQAIYEEVID